MTHVFECIVGGRTISIETGRLAQQANGSVLVRYGDTVILVTACASDEPREDVDFLPLIVDYEERLYAAGKIPGGFFRREGRPTQEAILACRLTDRPLRPLFPKGLRNDVQIVSTVLSADQENDPDILSVIGASAALSISDIPFDGPVSAVRVGCIDGEFVINPTFAQLSESTLDLVIAGTKEAVVMVEGGAKEVPESLLIQAMNFGQAANLEIIALQEKLQRACGIPKMKFQSPEIAPELELAVSLILDGSLSRVISIPDRLEREEAISLLKKELLDKLGETFAPRDVLSLFESKLKAELREYILSKGIRPDSRGLTQIRPITCEVGTLPRTHGSGLFTRGGTQVLTITTLGSWNEEQMLDGIGVEESKRFMHHYNFPPFSTGEVKRIGSPGRREIGHGALVERAIAPVLPDEDEFPYTIRLVSEVLSSNGSTSMASVCSSSLSLMDAGVPIKAAVAGVAMGLITGKDGNYAILTDIEGLEDAYGDMDFKIAGTAKGLTALQMDIKLKGVTIDILEKALNQAHDARLLVLEKMNETISSSRPELSKYAPRIIKLTVDPNKIGSIIGPGGRTVRSIIEEAKVTIDIENDGTVYIGATSEEGAKRAIKIIEDLTKEVETGGIYTGRVTRLASFGAFVEILPGKEGLVHISELADYRVPSVEDVVKVGDEITVMVTEIDKMGRINLSRRAVFQGLSRLSGATVKDSLAPNYPFRRRPRLPSSTEPGKRREKPKRTRDL